MGCCLGFLLNVWFAGFCCFGLLPRGVWVLELVSLVLLWVCHWFWVGVWILGAGFGVGLWFGYCGFVFG